MDLHLLSVQIPSQLNSNFKSLCTEACEMSLNPFFASIFTMLYDALISQLLCFRASTTDLLFWLWLGCSCFYSRNLVLLWTWQSQGWGAIFQRKPSHPQYTWRLCLNLLWQEQSCRGRQPNRRIALTPASKCSISTITHFAPPTTQRSEVGQPST